MTTIFVLPTVSELLYNFYMNVLRIYPPNVCINFTTLASYQNLHWTSLCLCTW